MYFLKVSDFLLSIPLVIYLKSVSGYTVAPFTMSLLHNSEVGQVTNHRSLFLTGLEA